mmetsp:Transcript_40693/g.107575  ORF Transcript_40693/g.107575 Transcript_40693/m.107575 type:complete len:89 (+) Transcript_40693:219-485(+)
MPRRGWMAVMRWNIQHIQSIIRYLSGGTKADSRQPRTLYGSDYGITSPLPSMASIPSLLAFCRPSTSAALPPLLLQCLLQQLPCVVAP